MLVGYAHLHACAGWAALAYVARCDRERRRQSADVSGKHGPRRIELALMRDGPCWTLNGMTQPEVTGATDVDLAATPATNLMPLRRLSGDQMRYSATQMQYQTQLSLNPLGFVTRYPGLWGGEVCHAA